MEQNKQAIQVIIGNPPYSAGQTSANDNNQNTVYPDLDQRIMDTYVAKSSATLKNSLYDSYIRAMRWASDRIGARGIIGFVTNAGFVDSNAANGLRLCLAQEFSSIYILHLRGNARTAGELRRKERDNVFGEGSRAPIAISILVKNPAAPAPGQIYIYDIGDYLTREEKLAKLLTFNSLAAMNWQRIQPDSHGDWLQQRDLGFEQFMPLGAKKQLTAQPIFANYSGGIATHRDAWCYNADKVAVAANMQRMLAFYNAEVARWIAVRAAGADTPELKDFIDTDPTKISWTNALLQHLDKGKVFTFETSAITASLYRPFTQQWLYFSRVFNERVLQMPQLFPTAAAENRVICVSGIGARSGFSTLITNFIPCYDNIEKGQCFPLYLYPKPTTAAANDLFAAGKITYPRCFPGARRITRPTDCTTSTWD
ncbi:hypothetical protein TI04_11665 [Achromatium sp. WMS2]|nr:hypothetical protein TI04_11665 [Achromatium sp. WMS2]